MTMEQITPQTGSILHPATHMGAVTLAVSDLARSLDFYTRILGMAELSRGEEDGTRAVTVGVPGTPLLHLVEIPGAQRQPGYSTGLYHVAILVPSRPDLGRVILSLARAQYPIGGFGDHFVSEAMYLDDPDGNGLEIYRDRPRDEWQWNESQVVMGTEMVDVDGVIQSVEDPDAPYTGMPAGTTVGHMHLRVGNIAQARTFYHEIIGFDVIMEMPTALFVSAGRYHHHIGMNIWHSRGAPRPPENAVGLRLFTILVPDGDARDQIAARLDQAGIAYQRQGEALRVDDPWGNAIQIVPET